MSVSVVASWDPARGISQEMYASCDHCHRQFAVTGKGAVGQKGHRLTYAKRDGSLMVCERVFCSRKCAKQFIGYR